MLKDGEQKVDCLGTLGPRFCFVSCTPDWELEKLATWKYQWTQNKKAPRKDCTLAKGRKNGAP